MKKTLLIIFVLVSLFKTTKAQDFAFGSVTDDELNLKKYAADTSAHAVVLQEFGKARINGDNDGKIKAFYEYHVKIKIFDAGGFDKGSVKIPVYNNSQSDSYEDISDIKGVTYYKDDNGQTREVALEDKKIYPEKKSKHLAYYNFALPGLKNGCVIEYSYKLESPYWDDLHSWPFQDDIPKLYSEYEVHIPAFFVYNASLKGFLKLSKTSADIETHCFSSGGATCDCSFLVYGMRNIPAFHEEDYMTSKNNYLASVNFELQEFTNPYNGEKHKYTKEWRDIDYELKSEPAFGSQLKKRGLFKDRIIPVIAGQKTDLDKAKAVYAYVKKQFKWNDFIGIYTDGLSQALASHSGSTADINLSLINALTAAGLNAEAVLLSTRDNGSINTLYPVLSNFDYVIAKVNIGDQSYLLDASEPLLPFGMLPLRCLNDKGRVFGLDKPSYWIDLSTLPQKEKSTYSLDFTLQDNGKVEGTITRYSIGYDAYEKRMAIKKFNSVDEYVEDLYAKEPKTKVLKSEITNLDSLDQPLTEKYEIEVTVFDKVNSEKLAFNPFFLDRISTNPFKLADRLFPVDWGMPSEDSFILTMHLPAQYTIESPPQIISVTMPNNGGKFLTTYEPGDNSFTFSHLIQFNKSIYTSEEYPYLKELYNKIIQSEKAEMIFKKKS